MPRSTRVALALGSGGARGYAHIGVIQELEERGYDIVGVAGSSMGAVVGGLHAAGVLRSYADWVVTLTQRDVIRLLDPTIRAPGAIRAEKILAIVTELLDGAVIEDLPIPYTAVATDLLARQEVWFQRGPVDAAIRASIALPSMIPPVVMHGRLLADGGLMNPIPVAPTAGSGADVTIGVALSEDHVGMGGVAPVHESAELEPSPELPERSRRRAAQLLDSELVRAVSAWLASDRPETPETDGAPQDRYEEAPFGPPPPGLRTLDVMQLSLDVLQSVVTRYRLAGYPPDLLITVPKASCRTIEFHRAGEMIALGRELAAEALDQQAVQPQQ